MLYDSNRNNGVPNWGSEDTECINTFNLVEQNLLNMIPSDEDATAVENSQGNYTQCEQKIVIKMSSPRKFQSNCFSNHYLYFSCSFEQETSLFQRTIYLFKNKGGFLGF